MLYVSAHVAGPKAHRFTKSIKLDDCFIYEANGQSDITCMFGYLLQN